MSSSLKTGDQLISSVVKQDYTTYPSAALLRPDRTSLLFRGTMPLLQGLGLSVCALGAVEVFFGCSVLGGVAAPL